MAREKAKAEAAATQVATDTEAEQALQPQQPAAKRTIIPKLPVKFSLGKKPLSQPGKSRTAPPVSAAPPAGSSEESKPALPPIITTGKPTFAEPEPIGSTDAVPGIAEGGLNSRSQSENRLSEKRETSAPDLKSMRTGPGTESASAVPARLLPGGTGSAGPGASAPAAVAAPNLLSEAILIERGRRRMAATGSPAPGVMRAPSAPGVSRALAITPATIRVPTPPTSGSLPPKSSGSPAVVPGASSVPHTPGHALAGGTAAAGVIHSPQPVAAGKRGMFKSVPTPMPNTPVPGADYFDNKQDKDGRADLKSRKDEP